MNSIRRILHRGDPEGGTPEVSALHAAMRRASEGSLEAEHEVFVRLEHMPLWVFTVGTSTDPERLQAQARLSGHVTMRFRSGRTADGAYIAVATTSARLVQSGLGQRGDDVVTMPIQMLAWAARDGGLTLVINPNSSPFVELGGPVLAAFADGGIPDAEDPEGSVEIRRDKMKQVETLNRSDVPEGLLETLQEAVAHEPDVHRAVLTEQRLGTSRVFVVLAVLFETDLPAVTDRVARYAATRLGPDDYFVFQAVDPMDPRLDEPDKAIPIIP
jgi:hypothetical protein